MNIETSFHKRKRNALLKQLQSGEIAVITSSSMAWKSADQFYPFRQDSNFRYLTGLKNLTPSILILSASPFAGSHEILVIPRPDPVKSQWDGSQPDKSNLEEFSTVLYFDEFESKMTRFFSSRSVVLLNIPEHDFRLIYHPAHDFLQKLKTSFPLIKTGSLLPYLTSLRIIKDSYEINCLKQAIAVTGKGIAAMRKAVKHAVRENELEAEFRSTLLKNEIHELGYEPIIASGKNATILHYRENRSPIPNKSLILTDVGAEYNGYTADVTRVFPKSEPTKKQTKMHEAVLRTNKQLIEMVRPGIVYQTLNVIAKELLTEEALKLKLIRKKEEIGKVYMHRVSHFLGLDVHDLGDYDQTLKPGMVITIEPGLYSTTDSCGIRIEDDILITDSGSENLTHLISKELHP